MFIYSFGSQNWQLSGGLNFSQRWWRYKSFGIWVYTCWVVYNCQRFETFLRLLDPEDKGTAPVRNVGSHLPVTMTCLPEHLNLRYDNYFKLRREPYYVSNYLFPKCLVPRSNWINRNNLHITTIFRTCFCVFLSTSLFNRNYIAKRSSEMVTQISDSCP